MYKLHILNNKILRILQFKNIMTPVNTLYTNYNTLPIQALHKYKSLLFVHQWFYNKIVLPDYFHNFYSLKMSATGLNTRNPNDIYVIRCKTNQYIKSFKFNSIKLWNLLPNDIKATSNYKSFSKRIFPIVLT